jgi:membrane protease YdiL (CAAX protease family)
VQRHLLDPVSAALGVLAVAFGVLVATRSLGDADIDAGWWIAAAALVVALAIVPWTAFRPSAGDQLERPLVEGEGPELAVGPGAEPGEDAGDIGR